MEQLQLSTNNTEQSMPAGTLSRRMSSSQEVRESTQLEGRRRQGIYWLLTIPKESWEPCLPPGVQYIKGQAERGEDTGYEHWQVLVILERKGSLTSIKSIFGITGIHGELTRSKAAEDYVWKEATRMEGTQFEFGSRL